MTLKKTLYLVSLERFGSAVASLRPLRTGPAAAGLAGRRRGLHSAGAGGEGKEKRPPARSHCRHGPGLPVPPLPRGGRAVCRSGGHGAAPRPQPPRTPGAAPPPPRTHSITRATAARRKAGSKRRSTGSHRSSAGLSRLTLHSSGAAAGGAGAAPAAPHSSTSSPHSRDPGAAARPMALDAADGRHPGPRPPRSGRGGPGAGQRCGRGLPPGHVAASPRRTRLGPAPGVRPPGSLPGVPNSRHPPPATTHV